MPELSGGSHEKLDALLGKLVEETISRAELEELESLLDGDPSAQGRYHNYLNLHGDLEEHGPLETAARDEGASSTVGSSGRRPDRFAWLSIGVAALAVIALVILVFGQAPSGAGQEERKPLARLVDVHGPIAWWEEGADGVRHLREPDIGSALSSGTLESFSGGTWAMIEFEDGSTLQIGGHSMLTVSETQGGKLLNLRKGELSVEAVEQQPEAPMRVMTPAAEIEVIGTQFEVSATSYMTQATVNRGKIRMKRLVDGSLVEVPSGHLAIAEMDPGPSFRVRPLQGFVLAWESDLKKQIYQGELKPASEGAPARLEARPLLWKEDVKAPVLLHLASLDPNRGDVPQLLLSERSRLRFRGRLDQSDVVFFGMSTRHPGAGLAGKYQVRLPVELEAETDRFEIEIPIGDFKRLKECFPTYPIDFEFDHVWIFTKEKDLGLAVESVELVD